MNQRMLLSAGSILLSAIVSARAFLPSTNSPLSNFDNRVVPSAQALAVATAQDSAVAELRDRIPNVTVDFAPVTGAPKIILNRDGFLSGPDGSGLGIAAASLSAVAVDDPNRVAKAFLNEYRALFGHGAEALDAARMKREFVTPHNGMRTVVWEQQVDGIPVFEADLIAHVTSHNQLVNIASGFVPDPVAAANRGAANRVSLESSPTISAQQALTVAARNVGEDSDVNQITSLGAAADAEKTEKFTAAFLVGDAEAKLIWLPMDRDTLRLCWQVEFTSRLRNEMFRILVDAETAAVQVRHGLTDYLTDVTYRVFTSDSPSPFSPGYSTPVSTQPPLVSRTLVTLPALNTNASPLGWIGDAGTETVGNNVDAHTDLNNDNVPDVPRPQGVSRVYDFPMDLSTQNPSGYQQASVVQLFYLNNFMHDKLYELGFTEAAGNFQSNNFGRGGLGNDAVQADAQDGGGFNNANFSTPSDGSPGRMQMYVFNGPSPQRDGDFDAEVVLHEYTHGLSNRRVGGGVGISALQSGGMGEGWSDFYGLSLLSEAGDDVNGTYAAGAYVTYLLSGMTQNYYFGIRRYPYCTDMSKNPLTFKDIDPAQASAHTGIPRSSIVGTTANEVHNMGEVWCVTLWDARANLINKYGWVVGNQLMLQLVTDGMNLSPANPNFLQARDAIIQADQVDTGGANRGALWAAFAKRGMGLSASSPASSTTTGLVEAYDLPDNLQITPTVLSSSGPVGGPFTPNPAFFTLTNTGTNALTWALGNSASWITIAPTNGTLAVGAGATVSITISSTATNFPLGTTNAILWFTNQTSGLAQSRTFALSVVGRSMFENFEPGIHMPLWSAFGGTVGTTVIATNYGGSVSGVNSLWFADDGSRFAATIPIDTSAGGTISFYLRLGNGSYPWETVDIPAEGIVLEYSTNSGGSWTIMGTYDTATFYSWTQVTTNIPAGAVSPATQFRWRQLSHSGNCCDHWALDDISIDAGPTPPSILTQPVGQTVKSGSNVTFSVSAQGSFPLIYQWRKDGTSLTNGGRILGATNASLTISTLLESDSGNYTVLITNIYGSALSSNATLLVTPLDHFEWSTILSPQAVGQSFGVTLTAKDAFNATVTNFTGKVGLSGSSGSAQKNLTFDELPGVEAPIPAGYGGFTWSNFYFMDAAVNYPVSGYMAGRVSAPNVAYNAYADPTSLSGTGLFNLVSAYLTAAWNDNLQVTVQAYNGGALLYSNIYILSATTPTLVNFNYNGITRVNFSSSGGTPHPGFNATDNNAAGYSGGGTHFVMDNIVFGGSAISIAPTNSGNFTNGVWSGGITVLEPATNLSLFADDGSGHSGSSNPFDVLLQNDLSLTMSDSPDPVVVGGNINYLLNIANAGPAAATGVTVTNLLPPGVAFVSATSSQGTCTQSAGVVACNLGTLAGGTNATVSIAVTATAAGSLTNSATVFRAEADPFSSNNSASVVTTAQVPTVSITGVSLLEGNSGKTNAIFNLSVSFASVLPVTVSYATTNGTALADSDYASTNGIVTFAPGQTNQNIIVSVNGDTVGEPDETFFVILSNPTNATLSQSQATGTILNDDLPPAAYLRSTVGAPWSSTANETAMNRVFGTNNWQDLRYETANVGVLLSPATTFIFMEGSDNNATELETFLNANIATIQNWVGNGGSLFLNSAPNEDNGMSFGFGITLVYPGSSISGVAANPTHAIFNGPFTPVGTSWTGNSFAHATVTGAGITALITNTASGVVLGEKSWGAGHVLFGGMTTDNFHSPQPEASNLRANIIAYLDLLSSYHFEWSAIPSPQEINAPIPVTITARDVTNGVVTTFNGAVAFSALNGNSNLISITPTTSDNFTNGVWTGSMTVLQPAAAATLIADDGAGHSGSSNPFEVVVLDDLALTVEDSPDPVSVGANLLYTLTVTNTGPNVATGVSVTNVLPMGVTFVSATASQGTCTQSFGIVSCDLGSIAGGANATVAIVIVPMTANVTLTNTASASRNEADPYPANNAAAATTTVTPPGVSIADAGIVEGNVGTNSVAFAVTLASPSAQTVTVNYTTANGSAIAGSDYIFKSGIVSFSPGMTNQAVAVDVLGDITIESNETFVVTLSNPVNAILSRSQAVGTITNDDGLPGDVYQFVWNSIASPQIPNQAFDVTLSARDVFNAVVSNFNGSVSVSATATAPGITNVIGTNTVSTPFPMYAGYPVERTQVIYPASTVGGAGRIYSLALDVATPPGTMNSWTIRMKHTPLTNYTTFAWDNTGWVTVYQGNVSVSSAGWATFNFPTPFDYNGTDSLMIDFSFNNSIGSNYGYCRSTAQIGTRTLYYYTTSIYGDPVTWSGTSPVPSITSYTPNLRLIRDGAVTIPVTPVTAGPLTNGVWAGQVTVPQVATNVVLRAQDSDGHSGTSNPFHVVATNQPPIALFGPTNTSAYLGGAASFRVDVFGSGPISYQWRFNGVDIPNATNAVLTLNRVTFGSVGNYSALVWNPFGTNSSAKASLSIVQVVAWGAGTNSGGTFFNYGQSIVPAGLTNTTGLAGGFYHSLAMKADGKVSAWGAGTTNSPLNPHYGQSAVPPLGSVIAVAGGGYHSLALRADGTLAAWGAGTNNLLSPPYCGQSIIPPLATNIIAIAAGDYHSVALRNDGRVLVWGYNSNGQTNVPANATSNVVAVASRGGHVLAMKSDGSLVHWGSLTSLPVGVSNFITIAAGVNHCLGLKSDGTVVSWGSQSVVPFGLSNVVDIAAGNEHNLALRSDGTVVTWGFTNLYGRDQIPPGLSNVVGVACGNYNSLAFLGDGSPVIKWQPVSRATLLSSPATFSALAVGVQLRYQWQFNGTNILNATNFSYTIPGVQSLNAGNYRVIITNIFGAVTSSVANLTVLAPIGAAVDSPNLTWTASGNAAWFGETTITHDGIDAAQSGLITDNQQSTVQTTVSGPGVLNFWWKVSSEQYFDFLNFYVDSAPQTNISGEVNWQLQTFAIGAGTHTLKWIYQKDSSVSAGLDAGCLDQVIYTTNPPVITLQPAGQTNWMGATITLTASASGAPPITYQWLKSGTNLNGATSSAFSLLNVTRHDSGIYSVVASNPGGSTPGSNAMVLIRVPQKLGVALQPDGTVLLSSGDADGGLLFPEDGTNFEAQVSSNLFDWMTLPYPLTLTNGGLQMSDPNITNYQTRFYRVIEH